MLALLPALLFIGLAGGVVPLDPLKNWRARLEDLRWRWLPAGAASVPVTVVDIDDASLAKLGYWPWPRDKVAQLAQQLFEHYGAAVVGLDILYPEISPNPQADRLLGDIGRRYPLVFAQTFDLASNGRPVQSGRLTAGLACPAGLAWTDSQGVQALAPTLGALPYVGHISPRPDTDGILRRVPALVRYRDRCYPALSLAMLGALAGQPTGQLQFRLEAAPRWAGTRWLSEPALGLRVPLTGRGNVTIPWHTRLPATLSVQDVLSGRADPALLRNAAVLLGSSAAGLGDLVPTPLTSALPGVMVHAVMLEALVGAGWQVRPEWALPAALLFCWLLCWLLLNEQILRHPWHSLAVALGGGMAWLAIDLAAWRHGLDLPLLPPLLCAMVQLPLQAAWQGYAALRSQRRLFRQFSAYLPGDVLRHLIKTGADPRKLEAQRSEISVLFVDLVGFTRLAETLPPESVARLLNIVMERLARLVHAHSGTLDKFIGDALMAFWGAPLPVPDHADRALGCARAMLAALPGINQALAAAGLPEVRVGIGINSGPAAVGNLGSRERRAYSAVGATVNVAARLESLTRELKEPLLLGEGTCRLISGGALQPLGRFKVRGSSQRYLVAKPL